MPPTLKPTASLSLEGWSLVKERAAGGAAPAARQDGP